MLMDIDRPEKRILLKSISRAYLISMRERIKKLIVGLLSKDYERAIENYWKDQQNTNKNLTLKTDFDEIEPKYFEYYLDIYLGEYKESLNEEMRLEWMIKYYLDMDAHFVEQDPNLEDSEV